VTTQYDHHVVIVGGGFGGLNAAKKFKRMLVRVTLIDKTNFHLFQPLLYQVATGGLSPGDIASPLRGVLKDQRNVTVLQAEVVDLDPAQNKVILRDGELTYDSLIISTGVSHHYFGHDEWAQRAPGLKTIDDALEIRRRIFRAFEAAEREPDPDRRRAWMTFVVAGGGPTGVELAGALGELVRTTLRDDFRHIDTAKSRIILAEGLDRVLPPYPPKLSREAAEDLMDRGVEVRTQTLLTNIQDGVVTLKSGDHEERIETRTVLWSAGVKASPMGRVIQQRTGAEADKAGRIKVAPDLSVPGCPNIFVIGDLAFYDHQNGEPLPAVATVAIQQGHYAARLIQARVRGKTFPPFHYNDKGSMAVIGRNDAVARIGNLKFGGYLAWLIWVFVHINSLIEFDKRLLVLFQWSLNYFTRKRGARLITGDESVELVKR
jgi:NADH dehydrogenase